MAVTSSRQTWHLTHEGVTHRVASRGQAPRVVEWYVDEELVATKKDMSNELVLSPGDGLGAEGKDLPGAQRESLDARQLGAVKLTFSALGEPRRATLFVQSGRVTSIVQASLGPGGIDLVPEPGSPAAAYEQKLRDHPLRATLLHTGLGFAKVVVPLLLAALLARLVLKLDWPWDLPEIPWPNLPSIRWPDWQLPRIPWPDWQPPAWLIWIAEHAKYVIPIVVGFFYARREIRRRRRQDELRRAQDAEPGPRA